MKLRIHKGPFHSKYWTSLLNVVFEQSGIWGIEPYLAILPVL